VNLSSFAKSQTSERTMNDESPFSSNDDFLEYLMGDDDDDEEDAALLSLLLAHRRAKRRRQRAKTKLQ
jgi:hypothetical protein